MLRFLFVYCSAIQQQKPDTSLKRRSTNTIGGAAGEYEEGGYTFEGTNNINAMESYSTRPYSVPSVARDSKETVSRFDRAARPMGK